MATSPSTVSWGGWLFATGVIVASLVGLETVYPDLVVPVVLLILLAVVATRPTFGQQLADLVNQISSGLGR